jgi:hypothetical protein
MSAKYELKRYIDNMTEDDARIVLTFFKRFIYPQGDPLTPEEASAFERAEKEFSSSEYVTLEEFEQGKRI